MSTSQSAVSRGAEHEGEQLAEPHIENLLGLEPTTKLTADDVKAMLASLRGITRSLALADPDVKAAAYAELGISITYHADGRALLESRPQIDHVAGVGVGGPASEKSDWRVRPWSETPTIGRVT